MSTSGFSGGRGESFNLITEDMAEKRGERCFLSKASFKIYVSSTDTCLDPL